MWTIDYKGYYIHGYNDRPNCYVNYGSGNLHYVSERAAKVAITKLVKAKERARNRRAIQCANPYA